MSLPEYQHWTGIQSLIHDAFRLGDESVDLLDEVSLPTHDVGQLVAQEKTESVATKTFRHCHDLPTFHDLAEMNVESLREAANVLQGRIQREPMDYDQGKSGPYYKNHYTASIIAVADEKLGQIKERSGESSTMEQIGSRLEAYAARLEYVYNNVEANLRTDLLLNIRSVTRSNWESIIPEEVDDAASKGRLVGDMLANISQGQIKLYDDSGREIEFEPYNPGELSPSGIPTYSFTEYLHDEVLPKILTNLGMVDAQGTEPTLNQEAQDILAHFQESAVDLNKLRTTLESRKTRSKEQGNSSEE